MFMAFFLNVLSSGLLSIKRSQEQCTQQKGQPGTGSQCPGEACCGPRSNSSSGAETITTIIMNLKSLMAPIKQPHVSSLMRNRSGSFSVGRMMEFLTALGQDVEIRVEPAGERKDHGGLSMLHQ
jgi:hypothetical protein